MSFDLVKFERAKFEPRTETVTVAGLSDFFKEDSEPVFVVRGVTASELHNATEASKRNTAVEAVVSALASKQEQVQAIRDALGMTGSTPGEVARRLELLVAGCVTPKLTLPLAVKIAESFPVEFLDLSNRIIILTGQGGCLVKPAAASRKTKG